MTPHEFITKWQNSKLKERAAAQEHFLDLCRLLGEKTPAEVDAAGLDYGFEVGATKTGGGHGFADVFKRGHFGWEYKGTRANLDAALLQLQRYAVALDNPPLLIVSDIGTTIRIHTNWTNSVFKTYDIPIAELEDAEKRQWLKAAFADPEALRPTKTRQQLTEEVAGKFAELARSLRARYDEPEEVAHFINRLVFCMFAEDVKLLKEGMFSRMLERALEEPAEFEAFARDLFRAMSTGGRIGFEKVAWFNGGLFNNDRVFPLTPAEIRLVHEASKRYWGDIDPSILGTLFERGLDPDKRSQLGAHYTDRDKIMMIIEPVIIAPLAAEWAETKAKIEKLLEDAPKQTREKLLRGSALAARTRALNAAEQLHRAYLKRLRAFRVLDPACGSGNFLYLALRSLKDLEHRAQVEAEALGLERDFPTIGPEVVRGIEINPYAAELARVSVWIGEIQWMLKNGFPAQENPVLKPLETIECRDAVLNLDGTRAEWPAADAIIGNPPFLGGKLLRSGLGGDYVNRLFNAYRGVVPAEADFVVYWVAKAEEAVEAERVQRVGLVTTNSVRGGANRLVLDRIADKIGFIAAWADEAWTVEGAAVRVSLLVFGQTYDGEGHHLDGVPVERINTDLTAGDLDLTRAAQLPENKGIAFMGDTKGGAFDIPGDPVSLGAGIASGGLGAFAGGTMKAGRLVQRVAGGLGAAAGNVALTGIADAAGKETTSSDYAYAAAWGLGLGFAFGPLARNPATQDLADAGAHAASRAMTDIERGLPRFSGGEGTLSAAPAAVDNVKLSQGDLMSIVDADVPRTAVESLRPDMAGRGATSDNPLMRAVSQSLGLDVVGKVGPNGEMAVNPFSAGEDKLRIMSAGSNRLYSVAYPQFDEWAKVRGVNWMKRVSPRLTDEWETFAEQITAHRRDLRADRDAHYDPQVVKVSKEMGTALEEHRQGNITPRPETPDNPGRPLAGLENVPANPRYMPRVYRLDKIMAIDPTGRKFIGWLEGSLLSAHKELGDKAETLARGLYSGVVRRGFNLDEFAMMARDGATADVLRSGMLDIGMSEADIADILARLPKGSKPGFTHLRLDLDETFVHPRTGLKLGDFTETNAFDLFDHYNHQASAWRAAGRIQIVRGDGEVLLDGVRSRKEISDVLQQVADKGYQAGLTPKQIEDDTALLREMFDRLFGVPHEKASSTVAKGAEIIRNLATMTSAGNFGLSAIPDMARIATVGGLRAMLQHLPGFRTEIVQGGVLRPRSDLAMDIAAFGAVDEFRHLSARRLPEDGMLTTPMQGALDKIGGYTRTGADAVVHLSGMNIINRGVREAARRVMASRFYRDAEKVFAGGAAADLAKLSLAELNRMKWFGLGDDMLVRVLREVKEHGETVDHWTGAKLNRLNPDAWTDVEAKHAFTMALNRAAGRASMEHDFGSGTVWDRSPIFRTFSQLRRFGLNAWHMNILHGFAMRDPEVFWDVVASTFAAAALYAARTRIEAATRSDPEKHLQERFAPGAFAAAVFQLGAYSSLVPALVDTGIGVAGANPIFGFRNSALPSDAWFGNPSVTFLNNLFRVAPSAFMQPIVAGRERSQPEWRQMLSILPFSNNIAVQSALGLLVQDAPRFAPKSQTGYSLPDAVMGAVQ